MALGKLKEKKGQSYTDCCFHGCDKKGRVLARLGTVEIAYCAFHRKKYGERVLNALVNARFNGKLTKFLSDVKGDLFLNPNSHLCDECRKKELNYIKSKIEDISKLEQEAERHNIGHENLDDEDTEWEFDDEKEN